MSSNIFLVASMLAITVAGVCFLIFATKTYHINFTAGSDAGTQIIHADQTPRVGGFAIFFGLGLALAICTVLDANALPLLSVLFFASSPIFIVGLYEDIKQNVTPHIRLVFAGLSGLIFCLASGVSITHVNIGVVDYLLENKLLSTAFSIFCIVIYINSSNLIDGVNGLAIGTGIVICGAIGFHGHVMDDPDLFVVSILFIGVLAGVLF